MLLSDADVKSALGKALTELVYTCATRHGSGYGDNRTVSCGDVNKRVGEDRRVGRRLGGRGQLLAGGHIKLGHAVVLIRGLLGRWVALALVSLDVKQHGLLATTVADVLQDGHKVVEVVSIDRPDVVESELLEERPTRDHAAGILVNLGISLLDLRGEELVDALRDVAEVLEGLGGDQARGVCRERTGGHRPTSGGRAGRQ
mmetsp:Transcript_12110/g.15458  ORF Transcript_12110/g.15458 Transcript_12110/m.15458 type:complete len:201 (-) Transcript_12110:68-670(-)